MKKNDNIPLTINSVSLTGAGVGRYNGMAVFVDNTAVGDEVIAHIIKVKKNYAVGKLWEIIKPSPTRVEQDCNTFLKCGGCSFRHIRYEDELSLKETAVFDAMKRIGGINMSPNKITPSPKICEYRNKAQYPITMGEDGIAFGFYARHSHRIIETASCKLQPKIFEKALAVFKKWADENNISVYDEATGKGLLRHLLLRYGEATGELMIVPVINDDTLPKAKELEKLILSVFERDKISLQYNINKQDTNVVLGEKTVTLFGNDYIRDVLCSVKFNISAASFYQVNRQAAEVLYKKAAAYISCDDRVILDLFCGIGAIGLSILGVDKNKSKKLYGVEIAPSAVENAKINGELGGFKNCEFLCADAALAAKQLREKGIRPDVVIVDPPRKGCDADLLNTICNGFAPKKLIYISCDPSTLARDSKYLIENGYNIYEYSPVDLFPRTAHVETICLFNRR